MAKTSLDYPNKSGNDKSDIDFHSSGSHGHPGDDMVALFEGYIVQGLMNP